ncbi:polymorphic toxin type 33 domain-containing protein, partial [Leptospira weilii]|uniref:polymorphic toxin type 33 domain-containing protein n=1 Tax=Leptospira weilii TaxID=28184 RepID=UPI000A5F25F2
DAAKQALDKFKADLNGVNGSIKQGEAIGSIINLVPWVALSKSSSVLNMADDAGNLISRNIEKLNGSYLVSKGIDAHDLKKAFLGKNADIALYDLYVNKNTKEIYIFRKSGKGEGIPTGEFIQ